MPNMLDNFHFHLTFSMKTSSGLKITEAINAQGSKFHLLPTSCDSDVSVHGEKLHTTLFLHSHVVAGIIKSAADSYFCWQFRISDKLRTSALQGTIVQSGCNWNHVCSFTTWCFGGCRKAGWPGWVGAWKPQHDKRINNTVAAAGDTWGGCC